MPTSNSWMPTQGRHSVNIGSSLGRALKARKGTPTTTKRANLPDRDFYSFRYNFKPPSINSAKPGTIEVTRGRDSTSVTVEQPSSQAGEGHVFVGAEQPAKEWDCVLIYDEETETYTLEKLDSYMVLTYERKTTTRSASPLHPPPSTSKEPIRDLDLEEQLERDLGLEDADGESDNEFQEIIPSSTVYMEEEEEEEIPIPPRPPSPPKPKPPRITKPLPKSRPEAVTAPKTKPGHPKGKKAKRQQEPVAVALAASDAEEEDLEFGQPAKRARPSPASADLALPGPSSTYATPLPPVPTKSTSSSRIAVAPPSPPAYAVAASDSEEDWDEVDPSPSQPEVIVVDDPDDEGEVEEEIDVNAFEREMNQHLEESDDDFLAAAVSPEPSGHPISLNQFAGGGEASQDEDDYSSSDDSDDD